MIACANAWLSDALPAVSAAALWATSRAVPHRFPRAFTLLSEMKCHVHAALAGGEPTWTPRASSSAEPPPIVEVEDAAILPRS